MSDPQQKTVERLVREVGCVTSVAPNHVAGALTAIKAAIGAETDPYVP